MVKPKTIFKYCLLLLSIILSSSCEKETAKKQTISKKAIKNNPTKVIKSEAIVINTNPNDFVPRNFVVFQKIVGDLNKDGQEDCVLIIKATEKDQIVTDENRGKLDRNRRGIIVLFKQKLGYELASSNDGCFSSENEDGGVYFPPELDVSIEKGNLYINYGHGRYGYWTYTFRHNKTDFELIGYDSSSNTGPRVDKTTSINFLTRKRLESSNISDYDADEDKFEDTWSTIKKEPLLKLSEIIDFDELSIDF